MRRNLPGYSTADMRKVAPWLVNAQPNALYTQQNLQPLKNVCCYEVSDGGLKTRFNNHTRSCRHKRSSTDTEFSKYMWKLSNSEIQYKIKWNIAAHASPCNCGSMMDGLCLPGELTIMIEDPELLQNKRSEYVSKCRHKNKFKFIIFNLHSQRVEK